MVANVPKECNASIARVKQFMKKNVVSSCLLCLLSDQAAVLETNTNFKTKGEIIDLITDLISHPSSSMDQLNSSKT
jgi:hypothetical protein